MFFVAALLISSTSACENPPLLQLFDRIRTFAPVAAAAWSTASIALIESPSVPVPLASRNFDAMMLAVQFTPTTPRPLPPSAPIVPDTCVPWPAAESSHGSHDFRMMLNPCVPAGQVIACPPMVIVNWEGADQTFAASSGCV